MITTLGATQQAAQPLSPKPPSGLSDDQLDALKRLVPQREKLDPERRALVETLAKQYRIPMGPKTGFVEDPNPTRETIRGFAQGAKQSALPIAGQIAGMTAGQIISPGNVPLSLTLGGIGGVTGTKLNETFGLSKPDELDYLLSSMAPAAGLGTVRATRRFTPGVEAAEQQLAVPIIKGLPSTVEGSKRATDAAYQRVKDLGVVNLEMPQFSQTVNKLLGTEQNLSKYGEHAGAIRGRLQRTAEALVAQGGSMPFDDVSGLLKRYRERVASAEAKGGEQYGAYKVLRKSLFDDMDAASKHIPTASHAKALRTAMGEAKKRIAQEELSEIVERYGSKMVTISGQTFEVIEPTKVLNKLRDIGWMQSAGPETARKVEQTLKQLAKVPKPSIDLRSGMGQEGRVLATAGAAVAGAYAAGGRGAAYTAAASYAAFKAHDAIAQLAMSDRGREMLVKLFKFNEGRIGERTAAILQFAASQLQEPIQEPTQP